MNEDVIRECIRELDTIKARLTGMLSHKEVKQFRRPNKLEVVQYFAEYTGNLTTTMPLVEPEKFYDFYESKGWKVGKNSMKDWKAAVRQWVRRNEERKRDTTGGTSRSERAIQDALTGIDDPNTI